MCCEWVEVAMQKSRGEREYITTCEGSHKYGFLGGMAPNGQSELKPAASGDDPALVVGDILLEAGFEVSESLRGEDSLQ